MTSPSVVENDLFNGSITKYDNDSVRVRKIKDLWKAHAHYFEKTSIRREGKSYLLWEFWQAYDKELTNTWCEIDFYLICLNFKISSFKTIKQFIQSNKQVSKRNKGLVDWLVY